MAEETIQQHETDDIVITRSDHDLQAVYWTCERQ